MGSLFPRGFSLSYRESPFHIGIPFLTEGTFFPVGQVRDEVEEVAHGGRADVRLFDVPPEFLKYNGYIFNTSWVTENTICAPCR